MPVAFRPTPAASLALLLTLSCSTPTVPTDANRPSARRVVGAAGNGAAGVEATAEGGTAEAASAPSASGSAQLAHVRSLGTSGSDGNYTFSVTVESPDQGCEAYANYWEVLSNTGELLYRRVLLHSHVAEQPFTRSGGPVPVAPDDTVWVRAHFHPVGYGGDALRGSVAGGFEPDALSAGFAADLADAEPLPQGCAF